MKNIESIKNNIQYSLYDIISITNDLKSIKYLLFQKNQFSTKINITPIFKLKKINTNFKKLVRELENIKKDINLYNSNFDTSLIDKFIFVFKDISLNYNIEKEKYIEVINNLSLLEESLVLIYKNL